MRTALSRFDRVDKKFARDGAFLGVNDGTISVLKIAKENLRNNKSVDTKTLIQSMGRKVKKYKSGIISFGVVGPREDSPGKPPKFNKKRVQRGKTKAKWMVPKNYARFVEFGTPPHTVGKGDNLKPRKSRPKVQQLGIPHPGAVPKPYLRPAIEVSRGPVHRMVLTRLLQKFKEAETAK